MGLVLCTSENQDDPYWFSIRQGIEKECGTLGVSTTTLLWNERDLVIQNQQEIDDLAGIIIISEREGTTSFMKHLQKPMVFVDPHTHTDLFDSVVIDFETATSNVIDHLLKLGHQQIGFIGGTRLTGHDPRYLTFQRVLEEKKLFNPAYVHLGDWAANEGYTLMKRAIETGHLPSAFFIASDPLAMGALHALHESEFSVPHDVSIVSFDGVEVSAFTHPPLTTVKIHSEMMGTVATRLIMERINGRDIPLKVTVTTSLIVRESSGPAPQNGRP